MLQIQNAIIEKPIYDILLDVRQQLTNGKLFYMGVSGEDIKVTCPFHSEGHEKKPSCYVRISDGVFNCFACGSKGPFQKFIAACFDWTISRAENWLIRNYATKFIDSNLQLDKIELNKQVKQNYLDESVLDTFESYHPYMTQRKLTDDVIKKFDIKYDKDTKSIVFPVRNRQHNLVALTKRSIENKTFYIEKGFDKSNVYCIDKLDFTKPVYITESQINCLTLWGYGEQSVAMFGCGCPDDQIETLNNLPVKRYIIAFDNDIAGKTGTVRLCKKLSQDKFVDVLIYNKNDLRDINDLSKEEFYNLITIDRHDYLGGNYERQL